MAPAPPTAKDDFHVPAVVGGGATNPEARLFAGMNVARAAAGLPLDTLSMGMSHDLEAAIAEGATIVRIGTAIFGERS